VLTVGQLNRLARQLLEECFPMVWVEGEISNFSRPSSGHWYFTLKDDQAQVRCAMFRNRNLRLRFQPQNGTRVVVKGKLSLYENRGDYQLIAEEMQPAGAGLLALRFEELKQRLQAEGLFAPERKRPLPPSPHHIAVITSATGAAIRDVLTVLQRRCPATRVTVIPVPVQGNQSAPAIVRAVATANRLVAEGKATFEVLLVTRGGGSLEDLWSFNEESVARAIAASALPVVSAVGHEVDVTIADFVADQRAATPSAAAELLSPDCDEWYRRLDQCSSRLLAQWQWQRQHQQRRLDQLVARFNQQHPGQRLQQRSQRVDELEQRLQRGVRLQLARRRHQAELLHSRLQTQQPAQRLQRLSLRLRQVQAALPRLIRQRLQAERQRLTQLPSPERLIGQQLQQQRAELGRLAQLLHSVSPLATLQRGYAIVSAGDGSAIRDAAQVRPGAAVRARLARGELHCTVDRVVTAPDSSQLKE
jgi:exodeoxyribonuclease VII large subunit